jgi:hypothetical protein
VFYFFKFLDLDFFAHYRDTHSVCWQFLFIFFLPVDYFSASLHENLVFLQQSLLKTLLVFALQAAECADHIVTVLVSAFEMVPEIVGVRIGQVAVRTNEGTDMSDKVMLFVYAGAGSLLGMSLGFFVFDNVFVLACYRIKTHPD